MKLRSTTRRTALALGLCLGGPGALHTAQAAFIVIAPTPSVGGSVTVTDPINFTINTAGNAQYIVLDDWLTSDGNRTAVQFSTSPQILLNGEIIFTAGSLVDNRAATLGSITDGDGYLSMNSYPVNVGDVMTLPAGTYNLLTRTDYNQQATQTFTGNMFITDNAGTARSALTSANAVPEPSTWAMLLGGAGVFGFIALRKRRESRA